MKSYSKPSLLLEDLPRCLVQPVTTLYKSMLVSIPALVKGIPALHNLQNLELDFYEACQDDYLLYQSLRDISSLKLLSLLFYYISKKGAQELCSTFRSSLSLERIGLTYFVGEKVRHFFAPEEHCSVILFSS